MNYSDACVELTKESEGYREFPYADTGGHKTVGYGHKIRSGEDFGAGLTEAEAEVLLRTDLDEACAAVERLCTPPQGLTQGQIDALTDFVFNVGQRKFAHGGPGNGPSTLLRELNAGLMYSAAGEFERWVFASGEKLVGLVKRRAKEKALFLSEVGTETPSDEPPPE